ncbi:MAG: ribonuclease P protein component [Pseudomonadota bacterium]
MTLPEASSPSTTAGEDAPQAGPLRFETLKKRADFLRAARARRVVMPGFILQARARNDNGPVRVGFTCSKKVGNAVARNRAKRRLRALAQQVFGRRAAPATDYVLVGRADVTASRTFSTLVDDLNSALDRLT